MYSFKVILSCKKIVRNIFVRNFVNSDHVHYKWSVSLHLVEPPNFLQMRYLEIWKVIKEQKKGRKREIERGEGRGYKKEKILKRKRDRIEEREE